MHMLVCVDISSGTERVVKDDYASYQAAAQARDQFNKQDAATGKLYYVSRRR